MKHINSILLFSVVFLISSGCDLSNPVPFEPAEKIFDAFEITKGDLTHWDQDSGPDLELKLITDSTVYYFDTIYNQKTIPFEWTMQKDREIDVSNSIWRMILTDLDEDGNHDTMIDMTFNPFQKLEPIATDDEKINLYFEDWKIEVTVRAKDP